MWELIREAPRLHHATRQAAEPPAKMWESSSARLDSRTVKGTLQQGSPPLSYREVIGLWQGDAAFRKRFAEILTAAPFEAFFWETPPVNRGTLDQPFEFVWVDAPPLVRLKPEPQAFAEHFASHPGQPVLSFPNLGGDAVLVVPAPLADEDAYTHLARFLGKAPEAQVDAFWQKVGEAMHKRISDTPVWLSTAGLGVSWLHLRLDSRPKYYRHRPYQTQTCP